VEIHPLKRTWLEQIREYTVRLLGRRYVFLRATSADVNDMEKSYCRIPSDVFDILGLEPGGRIICEYPHQEKHSTYNLRHESIKAYELEAEFLQNRMEREKNRMDANRFPSPEKTLGIDPEPDIRRIFLDSDARKALTGDSKVLHAIKVRRDLYDLFKKEFLSFGIVFLLSMVALLEFLPQHYHPVSLVVSILLSLWIVVVGIRRRVK